MNEARVVSTIGVEMPQDFPIDPYEAVHKRVCSAQDRNTFVWNEYAGAWNAVAHRFLSCAEHDEAFTESIKWEQTVQKRRIQEHNLFGFFITGLSVLESFAYGLQAIASMIRPEAFPMTTEEQLKRVRVENVADRFKMSFKNEAIAESLALVRNSDQLTEWREIRNILAHRSQPGRTFGDGPVRWKLKSVPIDLETTTSRRKWLAEILRSLMVEAEGFTLRQFALTRQADT